MLRISKAILERLIDHWTNPVGLKIRGEDVPDPQPDPQPDPGPGPSPEPGPLVKDLVYHSISQKLTGFKEDSYIFTIFPVALMPDDYWEISLELSAGEYGKATTIFSSNELLFRDYYGVTIYIINSKSSSEWEHGAPTATRCKFSFKHEPGGIYGYSTYRYNETPTGIWWELIGSTGWIQDDFTCTGNFSLGNNFKNTFEWYTGCLYATANSYIKVNDTIVWKLSDELIKQHVPVIED